jgi:hypothetical protein
MDDPDPHSGPRQAPAGGPPQAGEPRSPGNDGAERETHRPRPDGRSRQAAKTPPTRSAPKAQQPTRSAATTTGTSPRNARSNLLAALRRLQPRDQAIASLLVEHRTLTTSQLAAVLFPSLATARVRLYRLRHPGWVESFTPIRAAGHLETHWAAGVLAARYVAVQQSTPPPTARGWRDRLESIAASSHLEHGDGASQVFIDLLAHARAHPGTRLARWWGAARAAAALGQRVHPDGHGVWADGDRQVGFLLKFDTGTEFSGGGHQFAPRAWGVCAAQKPVPGTYPAWSCSSRSRWR